MVDGGGIGAFAGGFAKSFAASRENRRLRDLDLMREKQRAAHEERLEGQFREQQDFRVKQQKAVETYRAGQMELQQKQADLQKKRLDVDVMGGMEKAFNPKIPKPIRKQILLQTFKTLEIDPKSQEAKDFLSMANSLEDKDAGDIRSSLLEMLPEATPGQITAFTKAIVTEKMQMKDVLEAFEKQKNARKLAEINSRSGGGGVPTQKVQSRIMSPEPMAQQQPGGDMPIPGMEQPSGEPTAGGATAQQIRDRASELFANGFTEEGNAQVNLSRALDSQKDLELKEIVGPDRKNIWVKESDAVGAEAPSARPVKTPEEERLSAVAKASVDRDNARVEPWLKDADMARNTGPVLQSLKTANKSGKFTTGAFSNVRENVTKWAELLGANDLVEQFTGLELGNPAVAETIKSGSALLGTLLAERMGRATNMQVGVLQDALPGLMKTQRGNDIAIEVFEKANDRALQIEKLYDKYQDEHDGDLRPKAKAGGKRPPSFFEEADRIRRQPLYSEELEKEIKSEAKKGNAVDVEKLWEKAKSEAQILIGEDTYDKVGETEKGLPIIKYQDSQFPYVATEKDKSKVEPGMYFLWNDPEEGPTMTRRKPKAE